MGDIVNDKVLSERKRLHITPFNPDLLDRYLAPSIRAQASNISFHAVQTFPERGFGYVELPTMEADKLRKKLNGSTLKGTKVRIEAAKPERKRKIETDEAEDDDAHKAKKKLKKEKKRRKEDGVLAGHELEEGRHVKRGWKEDGAEKKTKKSKKDGKEGKKMLFKTSIPPNAMPVETKSKDKSKDKKEKKEKKESKAKQKAVVQEFKKSSKIVSASGTIEGKGASSFEDGKGWVDEAGNVIEAAPVSKKPKRAQKASTLEENEIAKSKKTAKLSPVPIPDAEEDVDSSSEVEPSSDDVSSVVSSDDDSDEDMASTKGDETDQTSAPALDGPAEDASTPAKEVHPLEALFKRTAPSSPESARKPKPQRIDTSFSFFNSGAADEDAEDDDEVGRMPPQTPHTKEDLEWRSMRSAAPTPDTAAIGRKFSFPFAHDGEDEDEEMHEAEEYETQDAVAGAELEDTPIRGKDESEFRKWFYENRGDLNRGWKKRRREERKSKRQRENRRLSRRVV